MTEDEYLSKRQLYATSDAPFEVIEAAIKKLDSQWVAQQQSFVEEGELDDVESIRLKPYTRSE